MLLKKNFFRRLFMLNKIFIFIFIFILNLQIFANDNTYKKNSVKVLSEAIDAQKEKLNKEKDILKNLEIKYFNLLNMQKNKVDANSKRYNKLNENLNKERFKKLNKYINALSESLQESNFKSQKLKKILKILMIKF